MKYKIYKKNYYDEYGRQEAPSFFIKKRKSFLGISYWKNVTHEECSYCDCYQTPTTFKTEEEAKDFITHVLCKGVPREQWIETPIREITCG